MARVKKAVNAKKKHKKVLKLAKGFYGQKSKVFRAANPAVMRSLRSAYIGRKNKKRDFRRLWIARINAAARMNGISYSQFMNGLKKSGIEINRKMLSEMAIHDAAGFTALVETAKAALVGSEISGIGVRKRESVSETESIFFSKRKRQKAYRKRYAFFYTLDSFFPFDNRK